MQYSSNGRQQNIVYQTSLVTIGDLRRTPCLCRIIDALDRGLDTGSGALEAFVRVAHFFIGEDKLIEALQRQPGMDDLQARCFIDRVLHEHPAPPSCAEFLAWKAYDGKFVICPFMHEGGCGKYLERVFPFLDRSQNAEQGMIYDPLNMLTSSRYAVSVKDASGGAFYTSDRRE